MEFRRRNSVKGLHQPDVSESQIFGLLVIEVTGSRSLLLTGSSSYLFYLEGKERENKIITGAT